VVGSLVTAGLRPPLALLALGRDAERWALRTTRSTAERAALAGLDALLASPIADEVVRRVLASAVAERAVEEACNGPFADVVARDVVRYEVVERVLAGPELEAVVQQVLESPAMERVVAQVVDSRLFGSAATRLLESEELWLLVQEVAQSPAVMNAITHQGESFAGEMAADVRERSQHADAWLERTARRVLRRGPRAGPRAGPRPHAPIDPGPA
jgi:hypothetical protein